MTDIFNDPVERRGTDSLKWDKYKGTDITPLWVADMDFPPPPPVQAALEERLRHPILGYTIAGPSVVEATLEHLQRSYGWAVEPEWLVWLPGVVSGLANACRMAGSPGDHVIVSSPIYHHFLHVAEPADRVTVDVPLQEVDGRWVFDLDGLRRAAADPRAKLMMLCSPHNPVGRLFSAEELQSVMAIAAEFDLTVVSDEIHDGIVLDPERRFIPTAMACPDQAHRTITLMSASKTYNLAGNNASFAVIPDPALRAAFQFRAKGAIPPATPLSYVALEAAFRHGAEWHAGFIEHIRANRDRVLAVLDRLPGLRMAPLEATYLGWIDVSALRLNDPPKWFEEHARVGFSTGAEFGDARFVRINLATQGGTLEAALERFEHCCRMRLDELAGG